MSIAVGRQSSLAVIATWSDIGSGPSDEIGGTLTTLLTDVFALCLKANDFHRHMSGRHPRDYNLMLDGQADEMIAVTDVVAEQFRKIAAGLLEQSERSSAGSSSMTVMMKCRAAAC